jgi:mannose-1-phosphate guanylyltransferase
MEVAPPRMRFEPPAPWGLVLAGGDGTRLQELTRRLAGAPIPKQYCRIAGDRSMLETTLDRLRNLIPAARTLAIVNRDHLPLARPQLRTLPDANVVVQAENRDTGPGLVLSLVALARRDPRATVAVFPSDHYVRDGDRFLAHVATALGVVRRHPERIVVLGMLPDGVDASLGYIEPGGSLGVDGTVKGVFDVLRFHEKPAPATAAEIIRRGGLWNSFVMAFRVDTMIGLLRRRRPAALEAVGCASVSPWNFSRDFLAHVPGHLAVVQVEDVGWSDWGTPEAIERTFVALNAVPPWRAAVTAA